MAGFIPFTGAFRASGSLKRSDASVRSTPFLYSVDGIQQQPLRADLWHGWTSSAGCMQATCRAFLCQNKVYPPGDINKRLQLTLFPVIHKHQYMPCFFSFCSLRTFFAINATPTPACWGVPFSAISPGQKRKALPHPCPVGRSYVKSKGARVARSPKLWYTPGIVLVHFSPHECAWAWLREHACDGRGIKKKALPLPKSVGKAVYIRIVRDYAATCLLCVTPHFL